MLKIQMESGEVIVGTPNYTTETLAEIRLAATTSKVAAYRTIERAQIERVTRVSRTTGREVGDGAI